LGGEDTEDSIGQDDRDTKLTHFFSARFGGAAMKTNNRMSVSAAMMSEWKCRNKKQRG
jgi:hypothetical protein